MLGTRCEILSTGTGLRASLKRYGTIAFIGSVEGLPDGEWIGVRLDQPLGKNDGTYRSTRYFDCLPLHGAFVRRDKINTSDSIPALDDENSCGGVAAAVEEHRKALETKRSTERQTRAANADQNADELVQSFWKTFTEQEAHVRKHVSAFIEEKKQPIPSALPPKSLDEAVTIVHTMREASATAASMYLSPYDIQHTQWIITKLLELIETTRSLFAPRKKFTFKSRPKQPIEHKRQEESREENHIKKTFYENTNELVYANRTDEVIIIDASKTGERCDLNFSNLTHCMIIVLVPTSAIRGNHLSHCKVWTGPIWGSLWLEHCHDCQFTVATRQLRVHHSDQTHFWLRMASHPIIEDCQSLVFGPYSLIYKGLKEQLNAIGLTNENGLWAKVHDFKWHKIQQSPHWRLMDMKHDLKPEIPNSLQELMQYK